LDGPLPKLCPAVALSHQDCRHSAVALLLKAALIQVSDYRLLGASGFQTLAKMASGLKQVLAKMKYSSPCLASDIFVKLANKYQIPYFTDDRSIFFPPQHAGFDLYKDEVKKKSLKKNLDKNDDFVYSIYLYFAVFFFSE
jgi:hypothetical protein